MSDSDTRGSGIVSSVDNVLEMSVVRGVVRVCDIQTNMRHIHTSIVSRHLATRGNNKYCAHLHHTLLALKRYFPVSLVPPLPNSEKINHTYTKSTPNHNHHHFVTLTYATHIISSTATTNAPQCDPWMCGHTPPE